MCAMWFRVLAGVMGLVFLGFTSVQFNDPDWVRWVSVYAMAALLSFAATLGREWAWISAPFCVLTFVWAATLLPQVRHARLGEIFGSFTMEAPAVEEAREGLGLLIVALWSAVLWIV
jgi:hypothetical protein